MNNSLLFSLSNNSGRNIVLSLFKTEKKYILELDEIEEKAKKGQPYRQIRYRNSAKNAKIEQFYVSFYEKETAENKSFPNITINLIFKTADAVTEFNNQCPSSLKSLYRQHCHTKNEKGAGANFISIFSTDKKVTQNFFLAVQKFDALDQQTIKKLSESLAIEIPAPSAEFTPINEKEAEEMYQCGERIVKCR